METEMNFFLLGLTVAALAFSTAADAKNNKNRGQSAAAASRTGCPPGLAKKNPPCIPPGQAKRRDGDFDRDHDRDRTNYWVGDFIDDDYVVLNWPADYGLDPYGHYLRVGDYVYRVDRDTREVLEFIGALANLLN